MRVNKFLPTKENWKKLREFYNSLTEEKETFQRDPTSDTWPTFRRAKTLFVSWFSNKIVGVAGLNEQNNAFVIIKKEFQGQGLGKKIISACNRDISRLGFKKIRAKTFNPIAFHVLKKEGFKELYTVKNVRYSGRSTPKTVHYFELPLSNMTKLTFPFRNIAYILYAKIWRSWRK